MAEVSLAHLGLCKDRLCSVMIKKNFKILATIENIVTRIQNRFFVRGFGGSEGPEWGGWQTPETKRCSERTRIRTIDFASQLLQLKKMRKKCEWLLFCQRTVSPEKQVQ